VKNFFALSEHKKLKQRKVKRNPETQRERKKGGPIGRVTATVLSVRDRQKFV